MTEKIRRVSTCAPDHECSPEEIQSLIEEMRKIENDTEIVHYDFPSIQEMKEIIKTAENYTGTWYHSKVILSGNEEDSETQDLKEKISQLGEANGIALSWEFNGEEKDLILKHL